MGIKDRVPFLLLVFISLMALLGSCASSTRQFTRQGIEIQKGSYTLDLPGSGKKEEIRVQYLGSSGFTISCKDEAVLIDPYFSNFRIGHVAATLIRKKLRPNEKFLTRILEAVKVNPASIKSVLVTHAHYDHLIDVPFIYNKMLAQTNPPVYGNQSVFTLIKHLIPDSSKIRILDSSLSSYYHEGPWVKVSEQIRFLPVASEHAPHWKMIKIFDGEACSPITKKEYSKGSRVQRWADGINIAYLIEFTQKDTFRIFIQSAATCPRHGFPPYRYLQGRPVHLALLCMASFEYVCDYPGEILMHLRPGHVIINHWEDFFTPYAKGLKKGFKVVRATNGRKFIQKMDSIVKRYGDTASPGEKYTIAEPLTEIKIRY